MDKSLLMFSVQSEFLTQLVNKVCEHMYKQVTTLDLKYQSSMYCLRSRVGWAMSEWNGTNVCEKANLKLGTPLNSI